MGEEFRIDEFGTQRVEYTRFQLVAADVDPTSVRKAARSVAAAISASFSARKRGQARCWMTGIDLQRHAHILCTCRR